MPTHDLRCTEQFHAIPNHPLKGQGNGLPIVSQWPVVTKDTDQVQDLRCLAVWRISRGSAASGALGSFMLPFSMM